MQNAALHKQIAQSLRNQIAAGVLADGQVLPSTRRMAEEWDTSVYTISEAIKLLVEEGLVETQDRSRRTVRAPSQERSPIHLDRPRVVLVGGYAGSGKTHFGRILSRRAKWAILDKDTTTRPVVEETLIALGQSPNDRESDTYLARIRPREYEALAATVEESAQCGVSVIGTAPFIQEFFDKGWIDRTSERLDSLNADLTVVWIYCDAESMHRFLRHRGAARDSGKLADWEGYINGLDLSRRPEGAHTVVDNSGDAAPLERQADQILLDLIAEAS